MKLIINSKNNDIQEFIYNYLRDYICNIFITTVNKDRLKPFDEEYNINSYEVICKLLKRLVITRIGFNIYNIFLDKNIKDINGTTLYSYFRAITYGSRSIKGYPIILDIFKYVSNNINDIYEEWLSGS